MIKRQLLELTPQWLLFAAVYAKTLNIQEARNASCLPVGTVNQHINDPLVQREIAKNMRVVIEQVNIDAGYLLTHLAEMLEADVIDGMDDNGKWLPLHQWTPALRRKVESIEYDPILTSVPIKVKFVSVLKLIELTGKHVNVAAFEERAKVVHDVSEVIANRMNAAQQRVSNFNIIDNQTGDVLEQ